MADTIAVPGYPSDNRVPGFYFTLDASRANTASIRRRVLLIGQMTAQGTATAGVATECAGVSAAQGQYGIGSQAALMVEAYRRLDRIGELWVLPLADTKGGTAAMGSLQLSGSVTQNGRMSFYVGDVLIEQPVTSGNTAAMIVQALASRINGLTTVPVQATARDGTLTLQARNAGSCGNAIALNLNLLGEVVGQALPAGITATLTPMQGGNGSPDTLEDALAGLGQRTYDLFIHSFTDTQSLASFTRFLEGRWQVTEQLLGHAITAFAGTYGEVTALANTINDPHTILMATSDSPTHPMLWAAQIGAQVAVSMRENPALPITGLILQVMPPSDQGSFDYVLRNSLLYDGISTFLVANGNQVMIERLITTYSKNQYGNEDDSYLNLETLLTAAFALEDMRQYLATQFSRCILLQDGAKISAGQKATTAELIGKSCVARYRTQADRLWVQEPEAFAKEIQTENVGSGVVKLLMPYRFSDQLFVIAGNCQFTRTGGTN